MRQVSATGNWTDWCVFFLPALEAQAQANIQIVSQIQAHYDLRKDRFREVLHSQYFTAALDYVFARPIFWNTHFVEKAEGPTSTLRGFTPKLLEAGLITSLIPPSGRAPGLYSFPSILRMGHA